MDFPIAIHKDPDTVYGVTVPDVPGCHSAGASIEEAIRNAREAIVSHMEVLLSMDKDINLTPTPIAELSAREEFADAVWALADVDMSKLDTSPERINVSMPRFVLHKIDMFVSGRHETRSGFLARAAMAAIAATR
ncbi:type II toxin-antitoxin system HicB family antitoxin [Cupriavidus agavae]|uniref:Putative RNase H-like HicB family nuclease n=1 Tax=Cupriavidus agavae TaxID=1001822 RepID=A0A4Q7S9A1_9BURK|nr:type II toxin-antitoxin system HicB family antitoxin [Cupriavidus agavae]RZT42537.1 putative RNase H-like HicB family nuclease [Cupriavidus agavae]